MDETTDEAAKAMAVTVDWLDNTQRIIYYTLEGVWTWTEFYTAFERSVALGRSVPHRIDVIVDFRQTHYIPNNALSNLGRIAEQQIPNAGLSVIITHSQFALTLNKLAERVYPKVKHYFRVVETMETALALVAQDTAERPLPASTPPAGAQDRVL